MSLSGPHTSLQAIKTYLKTKSIDCRWAHVHAFYHGGPEMEVLLRQTMTDVERRKISFPTWQSLHAAVRSVTHGGYFRSLSPGSGEQTSILEEALRSIFIETVDWRRASINLANSINTRLQTDSSARHRILGFGPGSRSLTQALGSDLLEPHVQVVDNFAESLALPAPDDIAIVGLSVNFPGGRGQEQLWETLQGAISTVTEVPKNISLIHPSERQNYQGSSIYADPIVEIPSHEVG